MRGQEVAADSDISVGVGKSMEMSQASAIKISNTVEELADDQRNFIALAKDLEQQAQVYREAAQHIESFLNGALGPVAQQNVSKAAPMEEHRPRGGW